MKKILVILVAMILSALASCSCNCSNYEVELEEIYGTYKYVNCEYVNKDSKLTANSQNYLLANKVKYRLKDNSYTYISMETNEVLFEAKNISFVKEEFKKDVSDEAIEYLKDATTRFDLYKDGKYQGYSFFFGKDVVYFMETRYILKYDSNVVWQIAKLEKIV